MCKIVKYTLEKYKKAKVGKERAKAKVGDMDYPYFEFSCLFIQNTSSICVLILWFYLVLAG